MSAKEQEQTREAWDRIAAGYDEFVTPTHLSVANEALHRAGLGPDMRFLDVAAGTGALSLTAARLGAEVVATDISPKMLARLEARAHKEGLSHVEVRVMDGHALELEDNTFDVAGSQFGVMLFPDMPRGIRELARVTKNGGRVFINAYGPPEKVEFFVFFVRALQAVIPGFTVEPAPLPFQLQNPERLARELAEAGLTEVQVETVTERLEFRSAEAMWRWLMNSNPVVEGVLAELNLTKAQSALVQQALERLVRERSGGDRPAVLTNPVHIGIGRK